MHPKEQHYCIGRGKKSRPHIGSTVSVENCEQQLKLANEKKINNRYRPTFIFGKTKYSKLFQSKGHLVRERGWNYPKKFSRLLEGATFK